MYCVIFFVTFKYLIIFSRCVDQSCILINVCDKITLYDIQDLDILSFLHSSNPSLNLKL